MKKSMVMSTAVVVAALATVSMGIPQARAAAVNTSKGNCSMLFQFNGLSNLSTSAYKGGFGFRHFIQDGMAIRPMVTVGIGSEKDKPLSSNDVESKETSTEFGAEITIEKHAAAIGPVSPYMGGQAGFSTTKDKAEVDGNETGSVKSTNFGVGAVAGFVWGFGEGVTLGGEYSLSFSTGSGERTVGDNKVSDTSRTNIGIGTASLFLSVAWK